MIIERVFDYCDDILTGKIKACKKHIWAVERFLKDYEDCQKDDSPYFFDEEVVEDFYWWAREFKHVEGILAGEPVELTDFQLFMAANIFGFKKRSNRARRFRKVYIQLARKNAKSQFLAIVASFIAFLGDEKQRAFIAGWTRDQSSEVYEAVKTGIESSELLEGKWREAYGKIEILKNHSVIIPLSKEARKTGDGKNPSVGIVDEYHAHETDEIYDVLQSGMVARREPLMFVITTAGFDLSKPCYKEYKYASDILNPELPMIENDEYFVMICELEKDDDVKDESNWIKANPIVATYQEGLDSIRSDLKVALDRPEKMRSFLTKNMNMWVDAKENGFLKMDKWNKCATDQDIDLLEHPCWIGVDLSQTIDLTSVSMVFNLGDGKYAVKQHSFMPEEKLQERIKRDKVPFDLWEKQGYLTTTPGEVVDYNFVEQYILNLREEGYLIQEIDYDKWNATHFSQNMENEGFTVVEIPQGIKQLSEPTKKFREEVYKGNIIHFDDPLLTWAVNNAVIKQDAQENIMLDKSKSTDRIDPIAAVINAFKRAYSSDDGPSVYEERGVLTL